jgi:hypothetical protein
MGHPSSDLGYTHLFSSMHDRFRRDRIFATVEGADGDDVLGGVRRGRNIGGTGR